MALAAIHIPFAMGLDERIRAELVDPAQGLLSAQNLVQVSQNAYQKRNGFTGLPLAMSVGQKLHKLNGALVSIDGANLWTYSAAANRSVSVDQVPECIATRRPIFSGTSLFSTGSAVSYDHATTAGLRAVAFTYDASNGAGLSFAYGRMVLDATTGAIVAPLSTAGATHAGAIRIIAIGAIFYLFTCDTSATTISVQTFDTGNVGAGWSAPSQLCNDWNAIPSFDACPVDSTHFLIAYRNNGGSSITSSIFLVGSYGAPAFIAGTACAAAAAVACACDGATIWIAGSKPSTHTIEMEAFDLSLNILGLTATVITSTTSKTHSAITIATTGAQVATVFAGNATAEQSTYSRPVGISAGNVSPVAAQHQLPRTRLGGKSFVRNGKVLLPVVNYFASDNTQSTLFLLDMTSTLYPRPVATIAPRLVHMSSLEAAPNQVTSVVNSSGSKWDWLTIVTDSAVGASLTLVTADFAPTNRWQGGQLGGSLLMTGGVPSVFDGQQVSEIGLLEYPDFISVTPGGGTGLTGTYFYTAIYEWVTASGELVRSAPCTPQTVVCANNDVSISVAQPTITTKLDAAHGINPPRVVIYRTLAGGQTYYRLPDTTSPQHPIPMNPGSPTPGVLTYTDANADNLVGVNEQLYRQIGVASTVPQGTVYPRFCPPSSTMGIIHNGRWWIVGDDQTTIWFTGQLVQGEQPWFTDNFFITVPDGGEITGLGSLDGALVVFKRNSIYLVDMQFGPADDGTGNDIGNPRLVSTDVGCTDPRSIVRTPDGIMFRSPVGIYTLTRSGQVAYTGWNVQNTLAANPFVVSATLHDAIGRVYFECLPGEGSSAGVTLVWDYISRTWSKDLRWDADGAISNGGAVSAVMIDGVYYYLGSNGRIHKEVPGINLDDGVWIPAVLESAWFKPAGLQGWFSAKSITLLASKLSDHDLRIDVGYDYVTSYVDSRTWTAAQLSALTAAPREQLQKPLKTESVEAVRFRFSDATPSSGVLGNGRGACFIGMSLEFEPQQGVMRLPAASK